MGDVIPFRRKLRKMTDAEVAKLKRALWPLNYVTTKPLNLHDFKQLTPEEAQKKLDDFYAAFPVRFKE